jgi:predicted MPP superfamily phosphohydrolase
MVLLVFILILKVYSCARIIQTRHIVFTPVYLSGSVISAFIYLLQQWSVISLNQYFVNISRTGFVMFVILDLFLALFFVIGDINYFISKRSAKTSRPIDHSRRNFIYNFGLYFSLLPFISFLHGMFLGRYNFKLREITLHFEHLPEAFDQFVIVQISDFHAGSFDDRTKLKKGFELIQQANPDLLVFTGDMVNSSSLEAEPYIDDFKLLKATYGKYSILGNHDYYGSYKNNSNDLKSLAGIQDKMGFILLRNEQAVIRKGNTEINLIGVENWGRGPFPKKADLDQSTKHVSNDDFNILLSHDPSHWEDHAKLHPIRFDLTLSGHTHGMQFGIETPLFKWSPVQYVYNKWAGLYTEEQQNLYVNRGFGYLWFAGRIGIWPEVTKITLRRKSNDSAQN